MAKDTIGIDVSKDRLDAFWHAREEARSFANNAEGFGQLRTWINDDAYVLIVFEATGAYHRGLERHLGLVGHPFVKVIRDRRAVFAKPLDVWPKPTWSMQKCLRGWVLCWTSPNIGSRAKMYMISKSY